MPTLTTRSPSTPAVGPTLHGAFDLGNLRWDLAFTTTAGDPPRRRVCPARDLVTLDREIARAKEHFHLPPNAPVVTCYEAGRDGFWLHRALTARDITNTIIDSASIEVNRRRRRDKSDRLDAAALLLLQLRAAAGDRRSWHPVHVPTEAAEDWRHLHRELQLLTRERTRSRSRIKGLLATQGLRLTTLRHLPTQFPHLRRWDGTPLPPRLRDRLEREWDRLTLTLTQARTLVAERRTLLATSQDPAIRQVRQLLTLRGIGEVSAWLYTLEFFAWRNFRNRRQVGALAGLTNTRQLSGRLTRDLGISKAGNVHVRSLAIELAWSWLRHQPDSALSHWYQDRFATGGSRLRRIGIVALARKLLIALWRYVETGLVPTGARLKLGVLT
jgi:transposase